MNFLSKIQKHYEHKEVNATRAPRPVLTDREYEIARIAVSFLSANIEAAEDALDTHINQAEVDALEKKLYA